MLHRVNVLTAQSKHAQQALTLGSLILAKLKNALFARRNRKLFTLYCDELPNLVSAESGVETILSEARKFSVGVMASLQFLDQVTPLTRSALLAVQTHALFRLSGPDADKMAAALNIQATAARIGRLVPGS